MTALQQPPAAIWAVYLAAPRGGMAAPTLRFAVAGITG